MDRDYTYTRLPTKLIFKLDGNLLKAMCLLIQQENYWKQQGKLSDGGFFYKSMREIADVFRIKNLQDARLIIKSLLQEGLLLSKPSKGGTKANDYKINWDYIYMIEKEDIRNLISQPMVTAQTRSKKKKAKDTEMYSDNGTELYQQSQSMIVQDCTTTESNKYITIDNNKTINNIDDDTYPYRNIMELFDETFIHLQEIPTDKEAARKAYTIINDGYRLQQISIDEAATMTKKLENLLNPNTEANNEIVGTDMYYQDLKEMFVDATGHKDFKEKLLNIERQVRDCTNPNMLRDMCAKLVDWLPRQNKLGWLPYDHIEKYYSHIEGLCNRMNIA